VLMLFVSCENCGLAQMFDMHALVEDRVQDE